MHTLIQRRFFKSDYGRLFDLVPHDTSALIGRDKYCVAIAAYFGGVDGVDHSNEFAAELLIESALSNYVPATGALLSLFDWHIERSRQDVHHLLGDDQLKKLVAASSAGETEATYWVAKMILQGDRLKKSRVRGLDLFGFIATPSRPCYCYEYGEILQSAGTAKGKSQAIHYYYAAASMGDVRALKCVERELSTGSDRFPYAPRLAHYWSNVSPRDTNGV